MKRTPLALSTALLVCAVSIAAAQTAPSTRVYATRADLESRLDFLDRAANSTAYSDGLRGRARDEATTIRTRLEQGDFQVGDRVMVAVENEAELSDTFTVTTGPLLRLPVVGDVTLSGVLRADLESHLATALSRFLRDPRLRARSMIRIAVDGAVTRPGFQTVPSEIVLADALTIAGGASPNARMDKLRVTRNGRTVLTSQQIEDALREGRTIDQLGVQAGDRLEVPTRGGGLGAMEQPLRAFSILLSVPLTIYTLTQIF